MHALFVICEGFDFSVEQTGVYDARGGVEGEVEDLRAEGDDWHRTAHCTIASRPSAGRLRKCRAEMAILSQLPCSE